MAAHKEMCSVYQDYGLGVISEICCVWTDVNSCGLLTKPCVSLYVRPVQKTTSLMMLYG